MTLQQENKDPIVPATEEVQVVEETAVEPVIVKKKKKKRKRNKRKRVELTRSAQSVIRSTMRNNIDLTAIADYKANILLTLSSLIFTILIPIVFQNLEVITGLSLWFPLFILFATCVTTMILAALATRPSKLGGQHFSISGQTQFSPFFFGNYYKIPQIQYKEYFFNQIDDPQMMREHIASDLYHLGKGLGGKYSRIRTCYSIFIIGIILTVASSIFLLLFF